VAAVGPSLTSLSDIAVAGGTTAYFITAPDQFDVRLEQFRTDALAVAGN
jgi:hypothetical protein